MASSTPRRRLSWNTLLWILAALLAGSALWIVASVIHHPNAPWPAFTRLWLSAHLFAATALVIGIAAFTLRREAQLARSRSDFIAGVSHDLRMPLAQILLAGETLALNRAGDEAARLGLSRSIVREARRLTALVDNVLLFARSGAVALRPRLQRVLVEPLFREVAEAMQLAVEDVGQSLELAKAPALAVQGDRMLLRQALVNLVDNALKYGVAGQTVRLGAEAVAEGMNVYVDDEGPGIPPALRKQVFQPYQRLARDQETERTGSGLGLAVVAEVARSCQGRVRLETSPSGGTRAILTLRAAEAAE